jgi:hypothetical protein
MSFENKQSSVENVDSAKNGANNVSALHADTFSTHMNSAFEAMQKSQGGLPREFATPLLAFDQASNGKTAGLDKTASLRDSCNNNPDSPKIDPDSRNNKPDSPKPDLDFGNNNKPDSPKIDPDFGNKNPDNNKHDPDSGNFDPDSWGDFNPDSPGNDPGFTLPEQREEFLKKQEENDVPGDGPCSDDPNFMKSDEELELMIKSLQNSDPILLTPEERQKLYPKGIPTDPRAEWERNIHPAAN